MSFLSPTHCPKPMVAAYGPHSAPATRSVVIQTLYGFIQPRRRIDLQLSGADHPAKKVHLVQRQAVFAGDHWSLGVRWLIVVRVVRQNDVIFHVLVVRITNASRRPDSFKVARQAMFFV